MIQAKRVCSCSALVLLHGEHIATACMQSVINMEAV